MATTIRELLADVVAAEPSLATLLEQHHREYGELLAHVLFGDITRWVVAHPASPQLLAVFERHLTEDNADVRDLLLASFVENLLDEPIAHLRPLLGPRLRAAVKEMETWHPEAPT